jgi:DNA polymerase-3 subunit alpha
MYLNCKTYFSYRYGTLGTEELVTLATENGANALALTNINNTSDVWDFVDFCKRHKTNSRGRSTQYLIKFGNR